MDVNRKLDMLKHWFAKCRRWVEAIEGLDDPHGEHLARLEERIRRLERDVGELRARSPAAEAP